MKPSTGFHNSALSLGLLKIKNMLSLYTQFHPFLELSEAFFWLLCIERDKPLFQIISNCSSFQKRKAPPLKKKKDIKSVIKSHIQKSVLQEQLCILCPQRSSAQSAKITRDFFFFFFGVGGRLERFRTYMDPDPKRLSTDLQCELDMT